MSELRLTPHRLTPDMVIAAQDGRVLLRVDLNDGTVEGAVEDMSEAGRIFVEHVRAMFGASTTVLSSPPTDDVREALAEVIEQNRTWTRRMGDGYLSSGSNDGMAIADAILAAFEVRPYGTVTDTEEKPAETYAVYGGQGLRRIASGLSREDAERVSRKFEIDCMNAGLTNPPGRIEREARS